MAKEKVSEVPVRFYRSSTGREPVLEWLSSLNREDRRAIGLDRMRVQFGWPIGMPLVRSLKDGLWEVRSSLPSKNLTVGFLTMSDLHGRRSELSGQHFDGRADRSTIYFCHGRENVPSPGDR